MNLIIFGAPGVGKGTQAKIISEKLNIKHISTGDILRGAVSKQTETGLKAKEYMDKGELVPDNIMGLLVKEALSSKECDRGFILDGYPRTIDQVHILQPILEELNKQDIILISLDAEEEVLVNRLTSRRQCANCNSIVNLKLIADNNVCPVCGRSNTLLKRKDDEENVIRNRLKIYKDTTRPVLEYYSDKVPIKYITGTKPIDEVSKAILEAIES